jgi:superfamily I DNA/RNA helicase
VIALADRLAIADAMDEWRLAVNGADPRKILLMTFSRRAAAEMARRVERIARRVIGDNAGVMTDSGSS